MGSWILRGLAFAAAMVVVRLFQGTMINTWQESAGAISAVLVGLFALGAAGWGLLDGLVDAGLHADPDKRNDLAMRWLLAGLLAGILSGAVAWLISRGDQALYTGGLISEVTTFAAFTALVVFISALLGATVGRWVLDRRPRAARSHGRDGERADTDVFTAVRGEAPTEGIPVTSDDANTEVMRIDPSHAKPPRKPFSH